MLLFLKTVKVDMIFWPSFLLLWFTLYVCGFEQTRDTQPRVAPCVANQRARDHLQCLNSYIGGVLAHPEEDHNIPFPEVFQHLAITWFWISDALIYL